MTGAELEHQLYDHLQAGRIPDRFLYMGDEGAKNWLRLEHSRGYMPTGYHSFLMRQCAPSLKRFLPPGIRVVGVSMGSGELERTILRILVDHAPLYYPVRYSSRLVRVALDAVQDIAVAKEGAAGLFEDLPELRDRWGSPALYCILGNHFSRLTPVDFFQTAGRTLTPDDTLLFDSRIFPDSVSRSRMLKAAERFLHSHEAIRFHLYPLLERGMNPDDCELHLELIPVVTGAGTVYCEKKRVHFRRDCVFSCDSGEISFKNGEMLDFDPAFLYRRDQIEMLIHRYGFTILDVQEDSASGVLLALARKREE